MCPACGSLLPADDASLCPTCHADRRLSVWRLYEPAWLGVRFLAASLDHLLYAGGIALLSLLRWPWTSHPAFQLSLYFGFFFTWTWAWGTTPGKALFRLRVADASSGSCPSAFQLFLREILGRFLTFFLLSPLGYLTVLSPHSRAQTLHDRLAKTLVLAPRPPR